jgi:hypothetical protein
MPSQGLHYVEADVNFLGLEDFRAIVLNMVSALLGAVLLYLTTNGIAATRKSRERSREQYKERVRIYSAGDNCSQRLITDYFISIAKRYLVANILWTAQGFLPQGFLPNDADQPWMKSWFGIANVSLGACSVIAFILALSKLSELDRIRRSSKTLLSSVQT